MISIIDYGAGNISSIKNALNFLGEKNKVVSNPEDIKSADKIIFPGVGSFGYMMQELNKKGLANAIKKAIAKGTPYLGICLGLQALFEESEESPGIKGLGIFKGKVVKFTKGKIPQIGWNKIIPKKDNIFTNSYVYFVNSYYVTPENKDIIATTTEYYKEFTSAIQYKNITAVQFHPEKSGNKGIELLRRWLKC